MEDIRVRRKTFQPEDAKSIWVEDGSFLRLKQLTLSYSFDKVSVLKNARIFVTGTNLITLTKYTGYDPEVSSYAQSLLQQGIDYGAVSGTAFIHPWLFI